MANKDFPIVLADKLNSVTNALPKNFNKDRFVQNCLALLNDNPEKYQKVSQTSLISSLMKSAYLGLDLYNGEAYLVPFDGKLQFMPSYIGSIKLAKKYSTRPIKSIYAKEIKEGDFFEEVITNGEPTINFKPKPLNDGNLVGVFAVVLYQDGGMNYDVMTKADVENTRKSAKASNGPAWTKFYSEMAKKTVLKRLCKHIDIDFESADQQSIFNEDMAVETDIKEIHDNEVAADANTVDFIDAEATEVTE